MVPCCELIIKIEEAGLCVIRSYFIERITTTLKGFGLWNQAPHLEETLPVVRQFTLFTLASEVPNLNEVFLFCARPCRGDLVFDIGFMVYSYSACPRF